MKGKIEENSNAIHIVTFCMICDIFIVGAMSVCSVVPQSTV